MPTLRFTWYDILYCQNTVKLDYHVPPSTETVVIVPEFKGFAGVGLIIYYGRSKKVNSYLGGNGAHSLVKMSLKPSIFYGLGTKYKNNGKITYIKEYKCDCAWWNYFLFQ